MEGGQTMEQKTTSKALTRFLDYLVSPRDIRRHLICLQVVILILTINGCVSAISTQEVTPTPFSPMAESFTESSTPTELVLPTPTETPVDQIKLDENSFIPIGEYPKDGSGLVLLENEYVGEAAKEVVLKNGLGEQAKLIEKMYLTYVENDVVYSRWIAEGATFGFTYLVSGKEKIGSWTIIANLKQSTGLSVPRVLYPIFLDVKRVNRAQCLSQDEILNIAITGIYPDSFRLYAVASPVGFGKDSKFSYFTDHNGNIVIGLSYKGSSKPVAWFNRERAVWQTVISESGASDNTSLHEKINMWIERKEHIPDANLFYAGSDVAPLRGVYYSKNSIFQGILLGTEEYDGNLIGYLGFEDKNKERFFMPFSLGNGNSDSAILFLKRPLRADLFKGSNYDIESSFSIDSGSIILNHIALKAIGIYTASGSLYRECQNETIDEYKSLCNAQLVITNRLPGLFGAIDNGGIGSVNSPLINGMIGQDGLEINNLPLFNYFSIHPQDEPSLTDY